MDAKTLEADCPDLSQSVISTILNNPRYSQTFLRDMQEERRRVETSQKRVVDELQEQFSLLPRQVIETTLAENGYNVERALGPLLERLEEFRRLQAASSSSNPGSVHLAVTSSLNPDLNETIHVTWNLEGIEPTKYDWIGLFDRNSNNKHYYTYQWTGQMAQGKLTFTAPSVFGSFEFRFFHGSTYFEHLAVSAPLVVGPVFEIQAIQEEKEVVARIAQRSGAVHSWAWVGLFKKSAADNAYLSYHWLKNKTEIRFAVPEGTTEELEVRLFASSYSRVAVSNVILFQ